MPWDLDNDRPIYLQLMERIQQDIVYRRSTKPDDKLTLCQGTRHRCRGKPKHNAKSLVRAGADGLVHPAVPADGLSRRMRPC